MVGIVCLAYQSWTLQQDSLFYRIMVTSNEKGARGETVIRDKLRQLTGLQFERVPGSGALDPKHGLKGDLYIPLVHNLFCIEVKNYEEDHLNSKILSGTSPQLLLFWEQAVRQGKQTNKKPLLTFKHNRSKIFVAYEDFPDSCEHIYVSVKGYSFYISLLEDWIKYEQIKFIKND